MNDTTVRLLRQLWREGGVQTDLLGEYSRTLEALVDAEDDKSIHMLQGKAKAYRALLRYPEELAVKVEAVREAAKEKK